MKYLIANWKAEVSSQDVEQWLRTFSSLLSERPAVSTALETKQLQIIVCPPFPFIAQVQQALTPLGIKTGSQTVSSFEKGKFTGEVTADVISSFAQYAIVGHSERRTHFSENEEQIKQKIDRCNSSHLIPIHCIRGDSDPVYSTSQIVAYEPVAAIGTGHNENPESVVAMKYRCNLPAQTIFLYGGSVNETNIKEYLSTGEIDGFLVGSASLKAEQCISLAAACI